MAYDHVNYADTEAVSDGLYFLRDALNCSELGVSVLDVDAGWTGMEHDHADDGEEEVYLLVEGAMTATVEGDEFALEPGDALRVDPEDDRGLTADEDSLVVVAGAP